MADNLPLIPGKGGTCADVRPVLREVFRELDYLPPLRSPHEEGSPDEWGEEYNSVCEELQQCAKGVRNEHAARVARMPPHNTFTIHHRRRGAGDICNTHCHHLEKCPPIPTARGEERVPRKNECQRQHGLLRRNDLMPPPNSNAARGSLWVENILSQSSGDLSGMPLALIKYLDGPAPSPASQPMTPRRHTCHVKTACTDDSIELSMGALRPRVRRPPPAKPTPPEEPQTVMCVPPNIDFINFVVGQPLTMMVRVVNVCTSEVRLAILPPSRRIFNVTLGGRLTVTSGAATELFIVFTPEDARVVSDTITIRVSHGRDHVISIECFHVPPVLDVLVPKVKWSSLSCALDPTEADSYGENVAAAIKNSEAVIDLGARLLGDVHFARLLLHSNADHAQFFILSEDAWLTCDVTEIQYDSSILVEQFVLQPVWWQGGGAVHGAVWCSAQYPGLQAAWLRVVASTAVARPLHLLADALYFRPDHITLQAHDKDYDICSDDDPACEYYVNLGTAFPRRSLSATVTLLNHSPVTYSYYWTVRAWGECSCWREELATGDWMGPEDDPERLCVGALAARERDPQGTCLTEADANDPTRLVRIEPQHGTAAARSSYSLHVCAPDVGNELGTRRAVLMMILKDIPKESFPPDFQPMVLSSSMVQSDLIPGVKTRVREVCEVVYLQMEVWWEVVPVRFVVDPPMLFLPHSRRVKSIEVNVRATQLFGRGTISAHWSETPALAATCPHDHAVALLRLAPSASAPASFRLLLPSLPSDQAVMDIITLESGGQGAAAEWAARVRVIEKCDTRHLALRPTRAWLGVVPPCHHMRAILEIHNNTFQHICWWAEPFRWWGENPPNEPCQGRDPCDLCHEAACTCALLRPMRGALHKDRRQEIVYDVNAPNHDGCVATVVRVAQSVGDIGCAPAEAGTAARAMLLAYRVLAPRLTLRALPCCCDDTGDCGGCTLDMGIDKKKRRRGMYALRPDQALSLGRRACYRLRITNLTPITTTVTWQPPLDEEEHLKMIFLPNQFNVGSYAEVEIKVVLEPRRVVGRRLWVRSALVAHAYRPLFLVVDASVAGVEVEVEFPLGGEEVTTSSVIIRRTQGSDWLEMATVSNSEYNVVQDDDQDLVVYLEGSPGNSSTAHSSTTEFGLI